MPANKIAVADWKAAGERLLENPCCTEAARQPGDMVELNQSTLDFIRDGADEGDRHRTCYSAAANLGGLGCSERLAVALLEPAGLDCGLTKNEIRRAVRNALSRTKPSTEKGL